MSVDPPASGTPMSERMQSLLSRAVEDQLSEQRQLAGALGEMRAQLQRVGDEVAQLRAAGGGGGASDEALASVSADVREAVRLLAERLDGVAHLVQQRGTDLAELKAQTADLQATVRGHGEALRGHGETLGGISGGLGALPGFGDSVAALQQRVDSVDQGLRELRSAFSAIGARMADVPGRADLDSVAQRAAEPVAQLAVQVARVEAAVTQLAAAQGESAAGGQDELRAELARFSESLLAEAGRQHERLADVETQVRALGTQTEAHRAAVVEAQQQAPTDEAVLAELADLRNELLGDGGLAAQLTAAQPDVADIDGRVSAAVEEAVGGLEQRLTAHIDEAVLALAEALLRRRALRPVGTPPPVQTPVAEPAAPLAAAPAVQTATPVADETPAAGNAVEDEASYDETAYDDEPADELAADEVGQDESEPDDGTATDAGEPSYEQAATVETVALPDTLSGSPAGNAAASSADDEPDDEAWERWRREQAESVSSGSADDDASRRRRPWWRPGD